MKVDNKQIQTLIFNWIKSDHQIRFHLRDIQIKLLIDRIVKSISFKELGTHYKASPIELRRIFEALVRRIERSISKPIGELIRQYSRNIDESRSHKANHRFQFDTIHLN